METYNKLQTLMWLSLVEAGYFANVELKAPENLSTKLEVPFLCGHVKTSLTKAFQAANISLSFGTLMVLRCHKDQCFLYAWYTIQATTSLWWCTLACRGSSTNNRILTCIIHPSHICSASNTCGNSIFTNWTSTKKAFQHNCPLHPSISVLLWVDLELVQ